MQISVTKQVISFIMSVIDMLHYTTNIVSFIYFDADIILFSL